MVGLWRKGVRNEPVTKLECTDCDAQIKLCGWRQLTVHVLILVRNLILGGDVRWLLTLPTSSVIQTWRLLMLINAVLCLYDVWRRQKNMSKFHESSACLVNGTVHPVDELNLLGLQVPVPCIPLFCFVLFFLVSYSVFIVFVDVAYLVFVYMFVDVLTYVPLCLFCSALWACFFYSHFSTFYVFWSISSSFFFSLFFSLSVWVLGASFLCLFSLSVCIHFSLSFYCSSFSIFMFLVPCYTLLLFFVQLSLSVYYCAIYYYRQPNNAQGATTGISAVELGVSVMQFVAI